MGLEFHNAGLRVLGGALSNEEVVRHIESKYSATN